MAIYRARLEDAQGTDFVKPFQAGTTTLSLHFRWDTANQEQWDMLDRALRSRATSEPLRNLDGTYLREYDWIDFYLNLPADLSAAYDDNTLIYPLAWKDKDKSSLLIALQNNIEEAKELSVIRQIYVDQLVWNVEVEQNDGTTFTGTVTPGGWINAQSLDWSLQFQSDLEKVGYEDLGKVILRVEVK